jgi:hypothetical protein
VTKTPVVGLQVTEIQFVLVGNVRCVHVIPSVEEAAMDEPAATATKRPVVELTVTPLQVTSAAGNVLCVHVIASVDEAAYPSPSETAT